MSVLELAASNLLSPAILCFAVGVLAVLLRSDLKLGEPVFAALSTYLMLAIGLKGGVELAGHSFSEVAKPIAGALLLGCAIPLWCYGLLRRFAHLTVPDAAAMAAHYGSVSAVTFAAVITLLDRQGTPYEGYAPALLAIMEVPAIVVAIGLASAATLTNRTIHIGCAGSATVVGLQPKRISQLSYVLAEILSSKSILLLVGGILIGALAGPVGMAKVKPFFVDLFQGALCLFLLELGRVAASRASDFRQVGVRLAIFSLAMPIVHAALGIAVAYWTGMSQGGAMVLGTLAASASYIAAPAAVRLALPDANPGFYLTCSLAITFPFNIVLGLPLYAAMAGWLYA